ncbi:unnamed protein product, partial [Prorocentrum cordatum]
GASWFVYLDMPGIYDSEGEDVLQPAEDWCSACGLARCAYPSLSTLQVKEKFKGDPGFKTEFNHIRRSLATAVACKLKQQQITVSDELVLEVSTRMAFTLYNVFTTKFTAPDTMKVKVVKLRGPEGAHIEGALVRFEGLPDDMPHMAVEAKSRSSVSLATFVLQPDQLARRGQADERREKQREKHAQSLPFELKVASFANTDTYDSMIKRFAEGEDPENHSAAQSAAQQQNLSVAGGVGLRRVGGADSDEEQLE